MKTKLLCIFVSVLFLILTGSSCKFLNAAESSSDKAIPSEVKQTYSSTANGNTISIPYPSFGISQVDQKFKLFAENMLTFDKKDYAIENTEFKADYEITLLNDEYISVKYNASSYYVGAAYPSALLSGITVRIVDGYVMKMEDFISWNQTDMIDLFVAQAKMQIDPEITAGVFPGQELTQEDRETIFQNLNAANYCLTPDSMIIFYSVPHAAGDYISVVLKTEELNKAVLHKWN